MSNNSNNSNDTKDVNKTNDSVEKVSSSPPPTAELSNLSLKQQSGDQSDSAASVAQVAQQVQNQRQQLAPNSTSTTTATSATNSNRDKKIRALDVNRKEHTFWDTQPMPHEALGLTPEESQDDAPAQMHCPIVPNKDTSELRPDPYNMPKGFEWSDIDILDPEQCTEVYNLLTTNYVEDDDCMFRFDYSPEFLMWALTPPGFSSQFHLGVRSSKTRRLMALITGVPATVRVYHDNPTPLPMVEINFLCVHKKLRSKRLAPVLIKEITRRVNHTGVFQAVYTAGIVLPVPVGSCRYYHRSLDPKKLIEVGFSRLSPRMTMARVQKLYRLPASASTPGLRLMTKNDAPSAHKLLTAHLQRYSLAVMFTLEEFEHWLLPRDGVIRSYVAVDPKTNEVTDMCSFYYLPSSVMNNPKHNIMRAAYSFYNVATTVSLTDLMKDALTLAKNEGQDVFNSLNLMQNDEFLEELKFGIGDGNLQYYLYNWRCPPMESKDVGIVLL